MRVRLTRRLAEQIDGIDLSHHHVGETFDLSTRNARLLIAEGWGEPDRRGEGPHTSVVIAFRRATDPGPLREDEEDLSRAS